MKKRIYDLIAHARRISQAVHPHTNDLLRVLTGLVERDVKVYTDNNGRMESKTILDIAQRLELDPAFIVTTFDRQITKDLCDYESFYNGQVSIYHQSHIPDSRIRRTLEGSISRDEISFVLHKWLKRWSPEACSLEGWFIEDRDNSEFAFEDIVRGYLISRGLAFPTTLHLLEESYTHQWANWKSLWEYF